MLTNLTKKSKWLSYILRHKPDSIGLTLDDRGWADVEELLNLAGDDLTLDCLIEIVLKDGKQRYSFNKDRSKVRANQGHTINIELDLQEFVPPEILYHGTAEKFLTDINNEGITPQKRHHVHLSFSKKTAIDVGKRHGDPVLLIINAKQMHNAGYKFFLSENDIPLVEKVPTEFINYNFFPRKF